MATAALNKSYSQSWPNGPGLSASSARKFRKEQKGFRQTTPVTNTPLAYNMWLEDGSENTPILNPFSPTWYTWLDDAPNSPLAYRLQQSIASPTVNGGLLQLAINKCYGKLRDESVRAVAAGLGETLAEARDAVSMIALRAATLSRAYKYLRKGDLVRCLKELRIPPGDYVRRHGRWTSPRDASSLWLEFWFGWSPLLGDIHGAMEVLSSPFPWGHFEAKASVTESWNYSLSNSDFSEIQEASAVLYRCQQGIDLRVQNPNVVLAGQLGVLNPLSVAWALVPFSFLVDWFVDVQSWLDSLTDFAGCEVQQPYTTLSIKATVTGKRTGKAPWFTGRTAPRNYRLAYVKRSTTLSTPLPVGKMITRLSYTRAATAMSLVVGIFSPKH